MPYGFPFGKNKFSLLVRKGSSEGSKRAVPYGKKRISHMVKKGLPYGEFTAKNVPQNGNKKGA